MAFDRDDSSNPKYCAKLRCAWLSTFMIGILARDTETKAVREFFQLFKTPWEFYSPQRSYDMVIVTSDEVPSHLNASVLLIYSSRSTKMDEEIGISLRAAEQSVWLELDSIAFPVYGDAAVLQGAGRSFIRLRGKAEPVGLEVSGPALQTARIGYDLFEEVAFLLSQGQPPGNAHIPTLDFHISLLRSIMIASGNPFVEIPAVPAGYDFMACLSHDVDFTGIREHKFDMTMWGFLYRAVVGSLFDVLRGKRSWSKLAQNWKAAFSLPFVHLQLLEDFWLEFDRFLEIEKGLNATYFFIPFKNYPGTLKSGPAPRQRAAPYDVLESKDDIHKLLEHGCEVGLHGIDAWRDSQKAQMESGRIGEITGQATVGVRMHWLYFDEDSPKTLDLAGFSYDSTSGYNDALGFRAGTTQVFSPPGTEHLLELPLNIQDTAMFYPLRMNLSETNALESCKQLFKITAKFGGTVTVNWHTRSLSPERLWGDFYATLLDEMRRYRVWFGTGQQIVSWFRSRRALCFEEVQFVEEGLRLKITGPTADDRTPFLVRIYPRGARCSMDSSKAAFKPTYTDILWKGEATPQSA
jgi:hypothetical protein